MQITKDDIAQLLDNPELMERTYRQNKSAFRRAFLESYPEFSANPIARGWYERLTHSSGNGVAWGTQGEWLRLLLFCVLAGTLAKLPQLFSLNEELFYSRNSATILFPLLSGYFAWRNGLQKKKFLALALLFITSAVYINMLPDNQNSDTINLACIHLVVLNVLLLSVAFSGRANYDSASRLEFLKYFGDLVVMSTLLSISFGLFTAVTLVLFSVIGVPIEEFYIQYVGIYAFASLPFISTHFVRTNPQLVNKVSPVIARVFTPIVLVMLLIYLSAWIGSGKDPFTDRDFLIVFNVLLLGVIAIIFFSVVENTQPAGSRLGIGILLALTIVTILVNGIVLSSIVYRIISFGITPNRLAVIGSNVLMLITLFSLTSHLFNALKHKTPTEGVAKSITAFMPIYGIWALIVTFLFPVLFGFR
ncbi:MAG: hypothetical protein RIQ47_1441 [Bacteroidota bacterium]|jgi:hypothetical protein